MSEPDQQSAQARFVTGSIFRHVVIMTLTGAAGLMAVFAVDLADLYFLSLLKDPNVTAAVGFAGTLSFANLSLSIGTGIAAVALVSRNMGARKPELAKQFATSAMMFSLLIAAAYTLLVDLAIDPLLRLLGASGETLGMARQFIWIASPGFICLAGALSCSFSLRGIGDAKRAMYITLSAAIATLILDPIFIFVFGMGLPGAAIANAIADFVALLLGLSGLWWKHNFLGKFSWASLKRDFAPIWGIALPSMIAQLATPFAAAYSTAIVAPYGNDVVTASTIIGRLVPVAFGVIFSLSGAVGPIIGQNFGAKNFERVRRTLRDGMVFAFIYTLVTSLIFFLIRHQIVAAFQAPTRTAELVEFFCIYIAASWAFAGMQFVANAVFNNLGKPVLSTWTNWAKATLGTIPFAIAGNQIAGPEGIMAGIAIGTIIFGIASVILAYKVVADLEPATTQPNRP